MKRLWLIGLLLGGALFAADPEDYRFFMELSPPQVIAPKQLNSVRLNDAVLEEVAALDDLRLYSEDGRELPFKREQVFLRGSTVRSERVPSQVESFDLDGRKAVILVRAGEAGKGAQVDSLAIRTKEQNFEKRVSIYGRNGGDWRLLAENRPFFDRNPRFALRSISFGLPGGTYRELKIEIGNYGEDYVSPLRRVTTGDDPVNRKEERELLFRELKIDGIDLSRNVPVQFSSRPYEESHVPEIRSVSNDPETKSTTVVFDCRKIPAHRLELLTGSTNFSRSAVFETEDGSLRRAVQLESLSIPGFSRRSTGIPLDGERRLGVCRLTIQNGDNPPLVNLALKSYGPAYRLITLTADIPARLCYAGNGVAPGDYDLARTLSGVDTAVQAFNEYRPGPSQKNPDFRQSGAPAPFGAKWLFPAAAVLLALALVAFIARNIGRVEKDSPGE
ncbi:MAG: hypothetical protein HPZ91_03080 [Lentisphaeria bacterium]|nr:hypothetical protein [Lentisphaeria bacterium]